MARVRLIDDDESQLEIRKLILERKGHTVVETDPEIVVMDLHIPSLAAGLQAIRDFSATGVRICVFSGYAQDLKGTPEEKLVHKILSKPAPTEELLRWLST